VVGKFHFRLDLNSRDQVIEVLSAYETRFLEQKMSKADKWYASLCSGRSAVAHDSQTPLPDRLIQVVFYDMLIESTFPQIYA
jgi:hypothetical protein